MWRVYGLRVRTRELCNTFFAQNRLRGTLYDGRTRLFDAQGDPVCMYSMGGLAEYSVMPAFAAAALPRGVALPDMAILGCAFLTAYGSLVHVGHLEAGESVVVVGAGGVGLSTIAVAKALGAGQIIAVDIDPDKLASAVALGATATVDATTTAAVAAVRDLTSGGANVSLEMIGNPRTVGQAVEMVAPGGRCVVVGIAPAGRTAEFEISPLVRRKVQILGSFGGDRGPT